MPERSRSRHVPTSALAPALGAAWLATTLLAPAPAAGVGTRSEAEREETPRGAAPGAKSAGPGRAAAAGRTAARGARSIAPAETETPPRAQAASEAVDFQRDVLPILEASCVKCHGEEARESGLRLDSEAGVRRGSVWGPVVRPGHSEESPLYRHLVGLETPAMPEEGDPLSAAEIATIRAWIDAAAPTAAEAVPPETSGASVHWAYVAPVRPEPPAVADADWPRSPIDRFVLARLEAEGLAPSPEAPRETLARRLSLDLVGLPPSPEEVEAFANDPSPDAYETLVERLLASPHYGERWARPWLDLARYADTHGYEKDGPRTIWKYRDWVIDSLNRDQSFRDFTIEQIAGDMLPGATLSQRIATGFHRNTMLNQEGGVDDEEARWETLVDRVNTTATVWLGTTLACAQCHDHKYDPFTQEEYYRLLAFFEGSEYEIYRGGQGEGWVVEPELALPTPEQQRRLDALVAERAGLEPLLETPTPELAAAQAGWEAWQRGADAEWHTLVPASAVSRGGARLEVLADGSVLAGGPNPEADVYTLELQTERTGLTGVRLEVLRHGSLPGGGPGRDPEGNFFLSAFEVEAAPADGSAPFAPVVLDEALADAARRGYAASRALKTDTGSGGWALDDTTEALEVRQAVFASEAPFGFPGGTRLRVRLRHRMPLASRNLGCFRLSVSDAADPLAIARVPARLRPALETPPAERSAEVSDALAALHRRNTPLLDPVRARLTEIEEEREALGIVTTLVMRERPSFERPSTPLRQRGSFVSPGPEVHADVPRALHPLPRDQMPNRLGLAHWLVDEANPLVARVTVNRIWQQLFGRGLVETAEDFGTRGARPTHPELLDWLATELVRGGWSRKALLRTIVGSATYRQSSRVSPELLERDPRNALLARGARFRVEAEMVRDVALTASGLLSREVGGPSVFPPQPPGIWARPYSSAKWVTSEGPDRYRRGLYTYLRRTAPYPGLAVFDAPSRELCTARRVQTNTPLQALTALNDPAFFEAAQALAGRMLDEAAGGDAARARHGFRLCTAREPDEEELRLLLDLHARQLERFRASPEASRAAAGTAGDAPAGAVAERAAWTVVANVLLNLDETLTRE